MRRNLALPALPALAAALAYLRALQNGWAQDDNPIVAGNAVVHGFHRLHDVLLGAYWPDQPELYRPVALLSFAGDWALSGGAPAWFHAVNVLWHVAATLLVFFLLARLGASPAASALGALVFAVHPLHVEAVANVVGRSDVMAAALYLAACLLHLDRRPPAWARMAGVAALYLLALGAKEIAVTLPAALVLLDAFADPREDGRVRRAVLRALPTCVLLAGCLGAYLGLRHHVLGRMLGTDPAPYLAHVSASTRVATAVRLWPEYVRLLAWPADLSAEWGPDVIQVATWSSPLAWAGLAVGALAALAAWRGWRRRSFAALAVLWFAATCLPVSHLLFPVGVMIGERILYLSSVAAAMLVPAVDAAVRGREARRGLAVLAGLLLALGAWRTWTRIPAWKDDDAVIATLLREHPESFRLAWDAAQRYARAGRLDESVLLYRRVVRMTDGGYAAINDEFADVLLRAGRPAEAVGLLAATLPGDPGAARGYLQWSAALLQLGRPRDALGRLEAAQRLRARSAYNRSDADQLAALAYDALGRPDSALAHRLAAGRWAFRRREFSHWAHLARLRRELGQPALAEAALDSARAHAPPRIAAMLAPGTTPPVDSYLVRGFGPPPADPGPRAGPLAPAVRGP